MLSKPLRYAVDCDSITKAPKLDLFKVERPEIVAWEYEQYVLLLVAAKAEGEDLYAAVCFAGEPGARRGGQGAAVARRRGHGGPHDHGAAADVRRRHH